MTNFGISAFEGCEGAVVFGSGAGVGVVLGVDFANFFSWYWEYFDFRLGDGVDAEDDDEVDNVVDDDEDEDEVE